MPGFDVTLNLPDFTIEKSSGFNPIVHDVKCHHVPQCPHCGCRTLATKDKILRCVWHESVGHRRVLLRFFVCKYLCCSCGRYFRQRLEGIMRWQRSTEALKRQVYRLHTHGISRKALARECGKSDSTISRYYDQMYRLENRKLLSLQTPRILGIDEHFFSRRMRFATTFCDLQRRRVFDVSCGPLGGVSGRLSQSNERQRPVSASSAWTCRRPIAPIARTHFPKALVVADRFHVVRIALHHLLKTCRFIDPDLKDRRGLSKLLTKHASNLTQRQARRLTDYLDRKPAIERIYRFKEDLMEVLTAKNQSKRQCRTLVRRLLEAIDQLRLSGFKDCQKLANTLQSWQEEIARMSALLTLKRDHRRLSSKNEAHPTQSIRVPKLRKLQKARSGSLRLKVKEGES